MDKPSGRFVFVGGRDRGHAWLTRLAERQQLPLAVYCLREDDHEAEKYWESISSLCQVHGLPCKVRRRLLSKDEAEICDLRPDLLVVMGWRTLISERILSVPRHGAVCVHESLLPAYRGFAPVNWAVINGEPKTGVTLFFLTTGMDNGDVVGQVAVPISEEDTANDVYQRTSQASIDLLEEHFGALLSGTGPRTPQDESAATYTCSRVPEDGLIDWARDTRSIHNLVRGLTSPYPGAFSFYGGEKFRIWSGRPVNPARKFVGKIPGRVVSSSLGSGVEVLTGDGIYLVLKASLDGHPPELAENLFRSVRCGFQARPGPSRPRAPTPMPGT